MKSAIFYIENANEKRTGSIESGEISIGRTDRSSLVLDDAGLSRLNTTIFVDDDEVFVRDENSLNGTFLNGAKISGQPRRLRDGDEIRIGSHTRIRVAFDELPESTTPSRIVPGDYDIRTGAARLDQQQKPAAKGSTAGNRSATPLLIASVAAVAAIILLGSITYYIVSRYENGGNGNQTPPRIAASRIPVRVIDPLGGEDEEDLDDLIASWETAETEIVASDVADVSVSSAETEEAELNVTAAFLADRQRKAFEDRSREGPTGVTPSGLQVRRELFGDGVIKQKAKLREMNAAGYRQPLDFAELAEKRIKKELIEMPMAAESYYLDVGGSASDGPFTSFAFPNAIQELAVGNPKYGILAQLASNFSGQKYDLNNPAHRKQMRMRLLRMFNKRAKPILLELAGAYHEKFNRPLRVTSLTRSMDYQILLNRNNPNSFIVRGEGSLPPHTSGCAFDLARKHMTAEEQNFVMAKLAEMENANKLDALIEYGANACFHVFIYDDGMPPKM